MPISCTREFEFKLLLPKNYFIDLPVEKYQRNTFVFVFHCHRRITLYIYSKCIILFCFDDFHNNLIEIFEFSQPLNDFSQLRDLAKIAFSSSRTSRPTIFIEIVRTVFETENAYRSLGMFPVGARIILCPILFEQRVNN